MKLNKLSYQIEEEKDSFQSNLWFELLIDGEPVEKLFGDEKAIPHFYFVEDDEIDLPLAFNYENKKFHLLGVCTCGHSGCGSTNCEIEKDENFANLKVPIYREFKLASELKFRFSRNNYDSVISEIKKRAKEYNEAIKKEQSLK